MKFNIVQYFKTMNNGKTSYRAFGYNEFKDPNDALEALVKMNFGKKLEDFRRFYDKKAGIIKLSIVDEECEWGVVSYRAKCPKTCEEQSFMRVVGNYGETLPLEELATIGTTEPLTDYYYMHLHDKPEWEKKYELFKEIAG